MDYDDAAAKSESKGLYNKHEQASAVQVCRPNSQEILIRRAQQLHEEANKLENLGKLMQFMPKEIEEVFYPLIEFYLCHKIR